MRRKVQAKDSEQERPRGIGEINGVFSVVSWAIRYYKTDGSRAAQSTSVSLDRRFGANHKNPQRQNQLQNEKKNPRDNDLRSELGRE